MWTTTKLQSITAQRRLHRRSQGRNRRVAAWTERPKHLSQVVTGVIMAQAGEVVLKGSRVSRVSAADFIEKNVSHIRGRNRMASWAT
jgi:kynureninase